jgi:dTDP-4-amino-4,6-dideoxygalactose transaminase
MISERHFNIYFNTPFNRNKAGDLQTRLRQYINIGTEIKAYLLDWEKMDNFPKITLYIPAEHDTFVQLAYLHKFLTQKQIYFINCNIMHLCNLFIQFGNEEDDRRTYREFEWAKENEIPIFFMPDLSEEAIASLKCAIKQVLREN